MTRSFLNSQLVIATHNKGKLAEFKQLFGENGPQLLSAADFNLPAPPETGTTFLENATLKALFVSKGSGLPALADDSGFCVDALGGAPGVYSADWAETGQNKPRDFSAAMRRVHDEMGSTKNKRASFACCLVLAWPDGHVESVEGRVFGSVTWPPRGEKGFGYDPIFISDGYDETYAEMEQSIKNRISHRALAFRMMRERCF